MPKWSDHDDAALTAIWATAKSRADGVAATALATGRSTDSVRHRVRERHLPHHPPCSDASVKPPESPLAAVKPTFTAPERSSYVPPKVPPARTCQWPNWRERPARVKPEFCDAPSVPGFSYCQEHRERCFYNVTELHTQHAA